jgi:DNA-binding MarR family transcriptional regulator
MAEADAEGRRPRLEPETAALRDLQTAITDAELALARRMRMNPTDLAAMGHLSFAAEPLGTGELSGRLGLSPGATTELVDRLERAGHLQRRRGLTDRRRIELMPTESATVEVLRNLSALFTALDGVVADLDESERAAVQRYLRGVTDAYRRYAADD